MTERPNVLVILIDDLRFDEFGAGGHPYMKTPHIDRLAREGVACANAFHTTPLCSPNRASILEVESVDRRSWPRKRLDRTPRAPQSCRG
jgi:hypothetical protein